MTSVRMNVWKEDDKLVRWGLLVGEEYKVGTNGKELSDALESLLTGLDASELKVDIHLYSS